MKLYKALKELYETEEDINEEGVETTREADGDHSGGNPPAPSGSGQNGGNPTPAVKPKPKPKADPKPKTDEQLARAVLKF